MLPFIAVMDKGVVEVEVDAMVVELEDSCRILDLEAPVEDMLLLEERGEGGFCDEGGVGVNADVASDVGCTPTKESSDVVALAPPIVGMVFFLLGKRAAWSGYKAKDKTRCFTDSQIEDDLGVKTSKKCECPVQIYGSVKAENENKWVARKVVNENQNRNPTCLKTRFIDAHCKEEMNCHVKRKLKLGHTIGLKHILWVDARSRAAYEEFNDVVFFDPTYLINQYELPFVNLIVGISYVGTLHEGNYSRGILTDQEAAMLNALRSTMPETRHHWCTWHITEKFSQKLGKCKGYNEFKDEISNAIYDSLSLPEFWSTWMAVINKHRLEDNVWLDGNIFASYFIIYFPVHQSHTLTLCYICKRVWLFCMSFT
ncbi:Protein FAR1-RELATED SEQUENCE 12 [Bienertia sinuspersici]